MRTRRAAGAIIACLTFACASSAKEPKLKPEELAARHLASLGPEDALAAAKNRVVAGAAQVIFRLGGQGQLGGKGQVVSDGRKVYIGMIFPALEYPDDRFGFDGANLTVSQQRPGIRSNLGAFVYQYDVLMREGLLGGTLTTAWPLLDLAGRQPKLNYSGLKKIEGRQLHELKYRPKKGGGDLQISLYFDPETFRHVLSQYRLVQPAVMASRPEDSSGQVDTTYTLQEVFSDFRTVDSLSLPHSYKLNFSINGRAAYLAEWSVNAEQVAHNQSMDPALFAVR